MDNKLLSFLGPTSTGKTDLAIYFAKKLNGELISADSRQVYKYLDLGTGKLPGEYREIKKADGYWEIDGIKIWLYDIADPKIRFNLYEYILKASEIINEIQSREKLPILVGGTGFYIRGLIDGISNLGIDEDSQLRRDLEELDIEKLQKRIPLEKLSKLNNSELNNKRRLVRLIEILESEKKTQKSFEGLGLKLDILKIGLTAKRESLKKRIRQRVIKRLGQGMIEEARELLSKNILSFERMDELGLEYRYLGKYLKGEIKNLEELIEILSLRIGQFAKRQMTWFKKEKAVCWFDIEDKNILSKLENIIIDWYNRPK